MGFFASSGILNQRGFFSAPASAAPPAFSPTDISGLKLWLKADAGVTESGGVVTSWADQSSSGANASAAGNPSYLADQINGLPAIEFDGSSMSGSQILSGTEASFFAVISFLSYKEVGIIFEQHNGSDNMAFYRGFAENGLPQSRTRIYNGTDLSGTITSNDNQFYILSCTINDSNANLFLDGSADNDGFAGDITAGGNYFIARWEGGGSDTPCKIAELLVYDNVLSSANRESVDTYLNGRYAIY